MIKIVDYLILNLLQNEVERIQAQVANLRQPSCLWETRSSGNSPIVCLDPDGKIIEIIHYSGKMNKDGTPQIEVAVYKNGQLSNRDGTAYSGNNSYIKMVANDLDNLKTDHSITEMMVNELDESNSKHIIANINWRDSKDVQNQPEYGHTNENRNISETDDPNDSYTKYTGSDKAYSKNIGDKRGNFIKRHRRVGLAHELKHAFDRNNGTHLKSMTKKTANGIPMHEVDAQNVENLVREKTGDPQNTSRGGLEIPKENLWKSNDPNLKDKMNNK